MKRLSGFLVLALLIALCSCGKSTPKIGVTLSPGSAVTVVQGQQKQLSATVSNDSRTQGVSWTLAGTGCSGAGCGSLTNPTATSVIYNAPATVTSSLTVTVTATSNADKTQSASVTITVAPLPSVTTASLPNAVQNVAYTATLAGSGGAGPYTWSVTSGTLPAGITLSTGGAFSGTPTTVGTSNFTVRISDSSSPSLTATKDFSITVAAPPLAITTTSLPGGTANSAYPATTLQSSGGTPPVSWSVTAGALPAGLTLHGTTGVIDGTPTATGTANITITATDSAATPQSKTKDFSIVISPALSITTTALPDGAVNTAYSTTLASTGGTAPITWSVTSGTLPTGLTLNGTSGVISGTPTAAGTSNFSVRATDHSTPAQTPEVALSITIAAAPLVITTTTLANGTIGTAYSATLEATGGTPPINWTVTAGALPSWASLSTATGGITGTPTGSPATTNFTVTATDSSSTPQTKTQALSITTVMGGVNNAELNGHYAFALRGFYGTGSGLVTMAGSLNANGSGSISGGVMDLNTTTATHTNLAITGGYYSVGSDQRGTMTLTTSQGDFKFAFSLGSISSGVASSARIIGFDSNVVAGSFKKQDASAFATSSITGSYAFEIGGAEGSGRFAAAGVLTPDGSGNFSISMDVNDAGVMNHGAAGPATMVGTISCTDSANGRCTMNDTTNGSHMSVYVISATDMFLINTDTYTSEGPPLFTGSVQKQSGTFNNASLSGTSVWASESAAMYSGGIPSATYVVAGLFTFNGSGSVTAEIDENDGGNVSHKTGLSGSYSVASNGRMTITPTSGTMPEVFYLIGPGKAFSIGTDDAVAEGVLKRQDAGPFSNASISGSYIFGPEPPIVNTGIDSGVVTANGSGTLTGTNDQNDGGTTTSNTFTETYTVSANGRVVMSENVMYLISVGKAVMIDAGPGNTTPTIHMIEQ